MESQHHTLETAITRQEYKGKQIIIILSVSVFFCMYLYALDRRWGGTRQRNFLSLSLQVSHLRGIA